MKSKLWIRLLVFCVLCIFFSFSSMLSGLNSLPDGASEDKLVKFSDSVYMVTIELASQLFPMPAQVWTYLYQGQTDYSGPPPLTHEPC